MSNGFPRLHRRHREGHEQREVDVEEAMEWSGHAGREGRKADGAARRPPRIGTSGGGARPAQAAQEWDEQGSPCRRS